MSQKVVNAFTVDVEDYYHVSAFTKNVRPSDWENMESRVSGNTYRILDLLNHYQVRATFYILGWVAERRPHLVRDIQRAGHEIGSHSYRHELVYNMTPEDFHDDLVVSCKILEDITGEPIKTYRAPSFSITEQSLWALDILIEEGIELDSSIYPIRHDIYGIPNSPIQPHQIERPTGSLWECPGTVCNVLGCNFPVGGGGYFRIFPARWTFSQLEKLNSRHGRPFVFYIHPWEVDPDQPRIASSWKSKLRHYTNLGRTESRMRTLLERFRFDAISAIAPSGTSIKSNNLKASGKVTI
ncbi:XrtA system polysaccharide deacetylase [Thalassoglobus polymorphus]|uniref:XrtA system polysaccharide deacetylase n=1 Tax=Thalassoglobus polymorphus TaxID=2527994 RepID=UPI00119FC1A5|nr:XrtA system polysaccharide deacetylase [Thalassoglobus polymorphus]